jgi:hypothetical protein
VQPQFQLGDPAAVGEQHPDHLRERLGHPQLTGQHVPAGQQEEHPEPALTGVQRDGERGALGPGLGKAGGACVERAQPPGGQRLAQLGRRGARGQPLGEPARDAEAGAEPQLLAVQPVDPGAVGVQRVHQRSQRRPGPLGQLDGRQGRRHPGHGGAGGGRQARAAQVALDLGERVAPVPARGACRDDHPRLLGGQQRGSAHAQRPRRLADRQPPVGSEVVGHGCSDLPRTHRQRFDRPCADRVV